MFVIDYGMLLQKQVRFQVVWMQGQSSRPDVVDTIDRPSFVNPSETSTEVHNHNVEMERK